MLAFLGTGVPRHQAFFSDFVQPKIGYRMHVYVRLLADCGQKFLALEFNAHAAGAWREYAPMMVPFIQLHQAQGKYRLEFAFFLILSEIIRIVLVVPRRWV